MTTRSLGVVIIAASLGLGCGSAADSPASPVAEPASPSASAPTPTADPTPAPTTISASPSPSDPASATAPVPEGPCRPDPTPLAITDGDLALETDHDVPQLRIARRVNGTVVALICTRDMAGSMEIGSPRTPTAETVRLGTTDLLVVQDWGVATTEGVHDDYYAYWIFDPSLRLLEVLFVGTDVEEVHVENDVLVAGAERRALRDGALVTP